MTTIRIIVVAYVVVQFGVGLVVFLRRRAVRASDYVVARGSLGMLVLGATLAATQLGSGVMLGDVAWTSAYGIGYYFVVWPFIWLGYWIAAKWIARKMLAFGRRTDAVTIPALLAARYGSPRLVRGISGSILLLAFLVTLAVQFRAAGRALGLLFGLDPGIAILLAAAVFLVYTYIGGLLSVAYNDLIHICCFVFTYVAGAWVALDLAGGPDQVTDGLRAQDPSLLNLLGSDQLGFGTLVGLGIALTLLFVSFPIDTMKYYSAKNKKSLLYGIGIGFIFHAFVALGVIGIGLAGRVLHPDWTLEQSDNLVPALAVQAFPPWLGGLTMAVIMGALMAVCSSTLLALAATLADDLLAPLRRRPLADRARLRITRSGVLVVGALGCALAFADLGAMGTVVNNVIQVLAASFAVTMLLGLTFRRPNRLGAVLSMIGGVLGVLTWLALDQPWGLAPSLPGFACGLLGMGIGIALGKPVRQEPLTYV